MLKIKLGLTQVQHELLFFSQGGREASTNPLQTKGDNL